MADSKQRTDQNVPSSEAGQPNLRLTPTLAVEDHGTEFYMVSRGEGHDLTLSLDAGVAEHLARFILERLGHRPAASNLPLRRQDHHEEKDSDR